MKKGSVLVSVIAFFIVFFVFCGFAIDFSAIITTRLQLQNVTENAVFAAVDSETVEDAENIVKSFLSYYQVSKNQTAKLEEISFKEEQKAVYIKTKAYAQTFFLSALGINTVELQAQSAAQIKKIPLSVDATFSIENQFQYIAPTLIFDKNGAEIELLSENGPEDYSIFVGLNNKEKETKWVEITCANQNTEGNVHLFDINNQCVIENNNGGISVAKIIRIINKNSSTPLSIEEVNLTNVAKLVPLSIFNNL